MRGALLLTILVSGCIEAPESAGDPDAAPDRLPVDAGNQLLVNPGFEEGGGVGWIFQPGGAPRIATAEDLEIPAQGGEFVAELGDSDDIDEIISQVVDVPEAALALTLDLHHCVVTAEPMDEEARAWDYCYVITSASGDEQTLLETSNLEATETCGWVAASIAITEFTAGEPLELVLVASNDDSGPTRCFYDSFELIPTF